MTLLRLWQAMVRATVVLLIILALAPPAVAEIACAEDSVVHLQEASKSVENSPVTLSDGPTQQQDDRGVPKGHCAFNHGHCAGIPIFSTAPTERPRPSAAYQLAAPKPLAPRTVDTPHHPPNA